MFDDKVLELLTAPLAPERISTRKQGGTELKYLEGYDIIDTANQIFGFDGWKYEPLEIDILKNGMGQIAKAKVKVEVWDGVKLQWISRADVGLNPIVISVAKGETEPKPEALDMAIKGAVTDAMKRCFRTFGNQFGNSLYDKDYVYIPAPGGVAPPSQQQPYNGQPMPQQPVQYAPQQGLTPPAPAPVAGTRTCGTCGGVMTHKSGTNKAGKPYSGFFCPNSEAKGCKPIWDPQ